MNARAGPAPKVVGGLWKKTNLRAAQVVGGRVHALGARDGEAWLLTASVTPGGVVESGQTKLGKHAPAALAVVNQLAVVVNEDGGGLVVQL